MRFSRRELNAVLILFSTAPLPRKLTAGLVLLLALLAYLAPAGQADQINGRVVAVADGDTITVLDAVQVEHKVRLAFVDAPERTQPFGQQAKAALSARLHGREVRVDVIDRDRYGRSVGQVWRNEGDVNLAQLLDGYAWHYRQYAKKSQSSHDFERYAAAQEEARQEQRGLWMDTEPTPPWQFRKAGRGE
ncbi:thermonuclease family protein [Crenobacter sp. SG2303]|uniref:Thermonuclease family protein n=1 Tax=Crenobacter oryzisoli TaxID=3056844 RepID=A0ABT7XRZ0_9NEIS|nr:thermonuclease family protein [Crenobacter sp. SG2303]MDN0076566.1 thermonuclease family protein [Crenobacter sp. SG2303]